MSIERVKADSPNSGRAPVVTVLMAAHNAERFIARSIESVLAQTFQDFELLVVDDGSTDGTRAVVQAFGDPRVRLLTSPRNLGLPGALNLGLGNARGRFVARQDHDDLSHPRRLEMQVQRLQTETDVALVGTRAWLVDEHERRIGAVDRCLENGSIRWYALLDNPFIHSSVLFRRDIVWTELGGYDASLRSSEDYELWSRVLEKHRACNLPDRLLSYRLVAASKMAIDEEKLAADPEGAPFPVTLRRIIAANLRRAFGSEVVSDDEAHVMGGFVLGIPAASLTLFLAVFHRLLERHERLHPDCWSSPDFRLTVATQLDVIVCRITPPSRRQALRVYAEGMRRRPTLTGSLPWGRVVSTIVFGGRLRAYLASARRHSSALARSKPERPSQ